MYLFPQKKNFVFIKVENYCENEIIKNENQLISTTKSDKQNHGFGLKSMIQTAQKYNGSVDFGVKNNWFELKILLPQGMTPGCFLHFMQNFCISCQIRENMRKSAILF